MIPLVGTAGLNHFQILNQPGPLMHPFQFTWCQADHCIFYSIEMQLDDSIETRLAPKQDDKPVLCILLGHIADVSGHFTVADSLRVSWRDSEKIADVISPPPALLACFHEAMRVAQQRLVSALQYLSQWVHAPGLKMTADWHMLDYHATATRRISEALDSEGQQHHAIPLRVAGLAPDPHVAQRHSVISFASTQFP